MPKIPHRLQLSGKTDPCVLRVHAVRTECTCLSVTSGLLSRVWQTAHAHFFPLKLSTKTDENSMNSSEPYLVHSVSSAFGSNENIISNASTTLSRLSQLF